MTALRVAVGGYYREHVTDNVCFTHKDADIGDDLLLPGVRLYEQGAREGVEFGTFDHIDPAGADVVLFLDLPRDDDVVAQRAMRGLVPRILAIIESPVIRPQNWMVAPARFARILSYAAEGADHLAYAKDLPATTPTGWRPRLACMIAGAKAAAPGTLYGDRLDDIRWFEENAPRDDFDLWGVGWPVNFKSYRGRCWTKREVLRKYRFSLCYENCAAAGYITEKILDSMLAGCVPVYLGAPDIAEHVPPECYVDHRAFPSMAALYAHLAAMTPEEYAVKQTAIHRFMGTDASAEFSIARHVRTILDACRDAARLR